MASENVITLTVENFDDVIASDRPVLVDFWASWCGPCRMVAPTVDKIADAFFGKALVGKVNVDEQGAIAARYNVMSIPTLMVFQNGQMKEKAVGVQSEDMLKKMLQKYF